MINLKERQASLSAEIEAIDHPPPILFSSLERLNALIERSEPAQREKANEMSGQDR